MENENLPEKERFEITDLSSLSWVMREILHPLKKEVEQVKHLEKLEIERIKEWAEKETRAPLQEMQYWEQRIADYHLSILEQDPKQRTLSTPYGKSRTRRSAAQPDKADDEKLLTYAKSNQLNDLIKVEESVKWGDLKKKLKVVGNNVVDENGEVVPGVVVKPETVTTKLELE